MKMKHQWILRKAAALLTALLLVVSVMPAACAASPDWDQLQIILSWTDESGTAQSAYAVPVTQTEAGEGVFWAMLPPEALMSGVTFEASHPLHAYEISPAAGTVLEGLSDAGQAIDGISYYPVSAYDPETGMAETFLLYVSTVTSQPELITPEPEIITPEPEIITPEPEIITPEPEIITPEPEIITPEPEIITPEPEIITPEPEIITPEPEIITPEPEIITPEPEIITPEPEIITPEPEVITPEPEIITPEPEIITPEPADLSQSNNEPTDEPTDAPVMPVGEMINRYGVTTTNVNYRKTPSTNGPKYSQLPSNTHVYLIITELNEKGEEWTLVEAEGHTGYLKSEFLRVLTEEDSEAYNLAQSTQAPVYDIGDIHPTEAPTPEPEATPEPAPTDTPTPEPTDTPEPTAAPVIEDGVLINRYATTNKGKVNVRQQPSVNSGRVTTLEKNGEHVYLLWSDTNDQGEHWTRVRVNGQDGYIKNDFLNLMTQEDSDAYSATQANPEKVYTMEELFPSPEPTAEPTATPEPTAEPTATPEPTEVVTATPVPTATPAPEMPVGEMINRYGMTKSKVFFRKEASTNAGKIAELSKNAQVYLIYTQENEVGEMWTYAMVNGQTGYIMTKYLNLLTEEDSSVIDNAQATRAPAFTLQDIFPTEEPTPVVTLEATEEPPVAETETPEPTDTPEPTEKPTEAPTDTPEPTEKPTEAPTDTPEPTEKPTEAPTDTPEPTEKPTEAPTDTPEPTEAPTQVPTDTPTPEPTATPTEVVTATPTQAPVVTPTSVPYQRIGYAITIGDGVPVRQWPTSNSSIIDILGANKIVYVTGQAYIDGETVPWSAAEFDGKWGYVRADMLRMISAEEMNAFSDLIRNTVTPMPETTVVPYVYNPDELSCYGYVTTDSVNFREGAGANTKKIRQMKRYALFLVYGSTEVNGETWYQVSYDGQMGYLNGKYFKQMTVSEADEFFASTKYAEGIANNSQTGSEGNAQNPQTTANPTGVVSAEDQRVSEWVNPATGSTVSYEPFDPFATPAPLPENELEKNEFVKSLIDQIQAGQLKPEDAQTELEKFYKDAKDPEGSVKAAMAYIQEKTGLQTEEPSESPEPQLTEEPNNEYPQEKSSGGGAGWIIALLVLAAAGGGGYYWYLQKQRKREAAQRIARKKATESRGPQGKKPVTGNGTPSRPVSAQNAAKVRTGTYTDKPGSARPKATPNDSASAPAARKPYSAGAENPYGRYTSSDTEEEASYTASFKPNGGNYRKPEVKDSGEDETKE